jgi:hypothetical protein
VITTHAYCEDTRKIAALIEGNKSKAMPTITAPAGTLTSQPKALQEVQYEGDL